jgi:hypothetical protein
MLSKSGRRRDPKAASHVPRAAGRVLARGQRENQPRSCHAADRCKDCRAAKKAEKEGGGGWGGDGGGKGKGGKGGKYASAPQSHSRSTSVSLACAAPWPSARPVDRSLTYSAHHRCCRGKGKGKGGKGDSGKGGGGGGGTCYAFQKVPAALCPRFAPWDAVRHTGGCCTVALGLMPTDSLADG